MNLLTFFTKKREIRAAQTGGVVFSGLDDPAFLAFIREGLNLSRGDAYCNMALFRCVCLISQCIAMLPLNLLRDDDDCAQADGHSVYRLLKKQPNHYQTAYEFKVLMQGWVLRYGNAYARIVRVGGRVVQLMPLHPSRVQVKQNADWSLSYMYQRVDGGQVVMDAKDVLHLRDFSEDGVTGVSRVNLAANVIGIAFDAEAAASNIFKSGVMAGGALSTPNKLSDDAYRRLKESVKKEHSGKDSAGKFMILEEGLKAEKWANTAVDAQHIENRNHQIEEIARLFAVPRPLLMMDDTSWGSGIGELGIFFVKYGLLPWFTLWEQALSRSLLTDQEQDELVFKFNPGALLRGSLKDQAEFFAKALGSGGHGAWMTQNEVRGLSDLPRAAGGGADDLRQALTSKGQNNEP